MDNQNKEKGRFKRVFAIAGIVLAVILICISYYFVLSGRNEIMALISNIISIIMPFIIGGVIAYLLKHICNVFEKTLLKIFSKARARNPKRVERIINPIAILLSYIVAIVAISALLIIAGKGVYDSIMNFISLLPHYIDNILGFVNNTIASNEWIKNLISPDIADKLVALQLVVPEEKLAETGKLLSEIANNPEISEMFAGLTNAKGNGIEIVGKIFLGTSNFIGAMIDFGIGVVISFFLLLNRKAIAAKATMLLHVIFKKDAIVNAIVEEAKFADRTFGGYIEGKIIGSTIVGLVYYIFLTLVGIPHAPLIAVMCGVTNIIPIFGPFIGSIPSGFIILASDPTYGFFHLVIFVAFVCIYQFIDGYIIDPHIVGGNIRLAPIWVIFAVILCGGLWGFPGLLIGVPLFAVVYDIVGKICAHMLKKNGKHHLLVEFKQRFSEPEDGKKKKKKKKDADAVAESTQPEETSAPEADETVESTENVESSKADEQNN